LSPATKLSSLDNFGQSEKRAIAGDLYENRINYLLHQFYEESSSNFSMAYPNPFLSENKIIGKDFFISAEKPQPMQKFFTVF
jgi:hypothetical protein